MPAPASVTMHHVVRNFLLAIYIFYSFIKKKKKHRTHLPSFQGILVQEGNVTSMFVCRHLYPSCPGLTSVASKSSPSLLTSSPALSPSSSSQSSSSSSLVTSMLLPQSSQAKSLIINLLTAFHFIFIFCMAQMSLRVCARTHTHTRVCVCVCVCMCVCVSVCVCVPVCARMSVSARVADCCPAHAACRTVMV